MKELIKECIHCEEEFDANSERKRKVGGYVHECADCVISLGTERAVKYRGVVDGSGKMAAISIVAFDSNEEADAYVRSFNGCGFGKRKTNLCNNIKHKHVSFNGGNGNHKGKDR